LGNALFAWAELIEGKEPEEARKKYERAVECYDNALKINPNLAGAWNNKGNALDELGRYKELICVHALCFSPLQKSRLLPSRRNFPL